MEKIHGTILVTGTPASGKTTIANVFSYLEDKCNVVDTDLYGGCKYDSGSDKPIWYVDIGALKAATDILTDKPTIIVGICENMNELINEFDFSIIYLIDHNPQVIAERLNLRYEKADDQQKDFIRRLYGLDYHDVESVNKAFAGIKPKILLHQADVNIEEKNILNIISDIALFLDKYSFTFK